MTRQCSSKEQEEKEHNKRLFLAKSSSGYRGKKKKKRNPAEASPSHQEVASKGVEEVNFDVAVIEKTNLQHAYAMNEQKHTIVDL